MSILDDLYTVMLAEVGDSQQATPDLWKRYLAALGYAQTTVLGQMQAFAEDNGMSIVSALNYVASGAAGGAAPPTDLHPNGTFDTSTGWVLGTGHTISGGTLNVNQTANANTTYDLTSLGLAAGTYRVEWELISPTAGNYTARLASVNEGILLGTTRGWEIDGAGVYTDDFVLTSSPTAQSFRVTNTVGTGVGSIDNVKLFKIA